jgi:hypothetical protein
VESLPTISCNSHFGAKLLPDADLAAEIIEVLAHGSKGQALSTHTLLLALLTAVEAGYGEAADATPLLSAGRPPRADPTVFAVEAMVDIWRVFTGQAANLSTLTGGFLAFAQDALCGPLDLTADAVRHAAEVLLPNMTPPTPPPDGAGPG